LRKIGATPVQVVHESPVAARAEPVESYCELAFEQISTGVAPDFRSELNV
jgi:hypothetical protein